MGSRRLGLSIATMLCADAARADGAADVEMEAIERPLNATEAPHFSLAKPTLSGHFAVLHEADLIEASKCGTVITYMLKSRCWKKLSSPLPR